MQQQIAKRRAIELTAANEKLATTCQQYEEQLGDKNAQLQEHKDLLDGSQRELKTTVDELGQTSKRDKSAMDLLERQIETLQVRSCTPEGSSNKRQTGCGLGVA